MTRTIRIRMRADDYDFVQELAREENVNTSAAVRSLVKKGRVMLSVERYKEGSASLGMAAELAGLPLGEMMNTLADYGVSSHLEAPDYIKGLANLRMVW